jgi:hypothetical protein
MGEFLDAAQGIYWRKETGDYDEDFALVFRALGEMSAIFPKARLDVNNLEAVFSAFDMAVVLGRLANMNEETVQKLPSSMKRLIAHTIEWALGGKPVNYCLSDSWDEGLHRLLKLHGSLNWTECACGQIHALSPLNSFDFGVPIRNSHYSVLPLLGKALCAKGKASPASPRKPEPFMIPPTSMKGPAPEALRGVWRQAAKAFSEASEVVVIGYSLPVTDEFFRYLFALGAVSTVRFQRFWVLDPDPAVEARFRSFLGPLADARFKAFPVRFEATNLSPITQANFLER